MFPVLLLELGLAAAGGSALEAQMHRVAPRPLSATTPGVEKLKQLSSLSAYAEREVERLLTEAAARVSAAVPMEDVSAKHFTLVAAERVADSALALQPTVEALYWHTTARGLRADIEAGQDQVELAAAVYEDAQAILDADPDHAGAHHILGRLHAGVMRLGRIKRFLTVRVLGGGAFSAASWPAAEEHFRAAIALEPSRVEHKLELAAVLVDTDRPEEARPLLEDVVRAPTCSEVVAHFQERARALLEQLGEGR